MDDGYLDLNKDGVPFLGKIIPMARPWSLVEVYFMLFHNIIPPLKGERVMFKEGQERLRTRQVLGSKGIMEIFKGFITTS